MTGPVVEQNFIKLAQGIALVLVDKFADSVERICCVGEGRKLEICFIVNAAVGIKVAAGF